jgi:hypothetical protein
MVPATHRSPRILAVAALIAGSLAAIHWAARHIREFPPSPDTGRGTGRRAGDDGSGRAS